MQAATASSRMAAISSRPALRQAIDKTAHVGRRQLAVRCSSLRGQDAPQYASRRSTLQQMAASVVLPLLGAAQPALADEATPIDPLRAILRAPADFYRSRQQANGGAKILAPIRASRARLEECVALVEAGGPSALSDALDGVRRASLNCYLYDAENGDSLEARASLLQQQLSLGDPCTFRLLHKNALTLVTDQRLEAEADASLDAVIRSFQLLDDMLDRARQGEESAVQAVPDLLRTCINNNLRFESAVKACIGLPA